MEKKNEKLKINKPVTFVICGKEAYIMKQNKLQNTLKILQFNCN